MALWDIQSSEATAHGFEVVNPVEVLDEFDGPLTFTFKDKQGVLLLANLCAIGEGVSRYLVCKTNDASIADLKTGMIPLRSALIRPPLWLIDVRPDGRVANAWKASMDDLPEEVIPAPDALLTAELEAEQRADERLGRFAKSGSDGQFAFDGGPVEEHEIDAAFYGPFVQFASNLLEGLCDLIGAPKPVLRLGMTSESSYAVDLKVSERNPDSFDLLTPPEKGRDVEKLRQALDWLASLVVDERPADEALTLVKRSYSLRQRYGDVLELLSKNGASLSVRTRTNPRPRRLLGIEATRRLRVLRDLGYPYMHLELRGTLLGGLIDKFGKTEPSFAIRVDRGDKVEEYKGPISDTAADQLRLAHFGDQVLAKLQIREAAKEQVYTLIDIHVVNDGSPHWVK